LSIFLISLSFSAETTSYEEKLDAPRNADKNEYIIIDTQTAEKHLKTLIIEIYGFFLAFLKPVIKNNYHARGVDSCKPLN
jgi:hypothetical protein